MINEFPHEIAESLKLFQTDNPIPAKCAFIMMRFGQTEAHDEIAYVIRSTLNTYGIKALLAKDKFYHDDLYWSILTYIYGCKFGIAVFERIEREEFNPNVAFEVGYMMALRKPVLLLKDRTLDKLTTDLMGKLYRVFDTQSISKSISSELYRGLLDKSIISPPAPQQHDRIHQAAAICFRRANDQVEFLVVNTKRGNHGRYTFPKGAVSDKRENWATAEKEAREEAGAIGSILRQPLAVYKLYKTAIDGQHVEIGVEAYLMEVKDQREPSDRDRLPEWCQSQHVIDKLVEGRDQKHSAGIKLLILKALAEIEKK